MKITGFIWLQDIVDKLLQKHNVDQEELMEVFEDLENAPYFRFVEKGHHEGENVMSRLARATREDTRSSFSYTRRMDVCS